MTPSHSIILFISLLNLGIRPCLNSVPHYKVQSISEARSLGKYIHQEIETTFRGFQTILSWTNLNATAAMLVEVKSVVAEMSSMSAMSTYHSLKKLALDQIQNFAKLVQERGPNRTIRSFDSMTRDEFDDVIEMFLIFNGWFHTPCNSTQLFEATNIAFDLKHAIGNRNVEMIVESLKRLVEIASNGLVILTTPKYFTNVPMITESEDSAYNPISGEVSATRRPAKNKRRKDKGRNPTYILKLRPQNVGVDSEDNDSE